MYEVFNAIAHLCMIILVFELFIILVIPVLAIGFGGRLLLHLAKRRLGGPIAQGRRLPILLTVWTERACAVIVWPLIATASLWQAGKTALASLRRQVAQSSRAGNK